jgi:hypothetical protein
MPQRITASDVAARVEALYGRPLDQLHAHVQTTERSTMLAALLAIHAALDLAERSIDFQLRRLRQLAALDGDIGAFDAGHILDCARRLAESIAARDAHGNGVTAVLQSLHRVPAPDPASTPTPAAPQPAPQPALTAVPGHLR